MYGSRIRQKRREQGLKLEDLAVAVGVSRASIANYETEYTEPKIDGFKKMARILNVSVIWLMGLEEFDNDLVRKTC